MPIAIPRLCRPLAISLLLLGGMASAMAQAAPPVCAPDAREQAHRLLDFHVGGDERIVIEPEVTELAPLRNPANPAQRFQVLEVWGNIYKGQYRMRLIYARVGNECILMGQELLEHASL